MRPGASGFSLKHRVAALERERGRLEGCLELTETAESTMRAERTERRRLQERLEASGKPWWRRMFGR